MNRKEYTIYYESSNTGHKLYTRKTLKGANALFDRLSQRDNCIKVALHDGDDYQPVLRKYNR